MATVPVLSGKRQKEIQSSPLSGSSREGVQKCETVRMEDSPSITCHHEADQHFHQPEIRKSESSVRNLCAINKAHAQSMDEVGHDHHLSRTLNLSLDDQQLWQVQKRQQQWQQQADPRMLPLVPQSDFLGSRGRRGNYRGHGELEASGQLQETQSVNDTAFLSAFDPSLTMAAEYDHPALISMAVHGKDIYEKYIHRRTEQQIGNVQQQEEQQFPSLQQMVPAAWF